MGMDQYLLIPFLLGWTSINPSYFDVNYRGTRFWHTATWFKSQIWKKKSGNSSPPIMTRPTSKIRPGPSSWNGQPGMGFVHHGPIWSHGHLGDGLGHWARTYFMGSRPYSKRVLQHPKILFRVHAASNAKLPCSRTHLQVQLTGIVQVDKDRILLYSHLSAGFWVSGWSLPGWFQPIQQYES